jgi:hypothetical protein
MYLISHSLLNILIIFVIFALLIELTEVIIDAEQIILRTNVLIYEIVNFQMNNNKTGS